MESNDIETIIVFTDGACSNNGYLNAKAGIGIHFPNGELPDLNRVVKKNPTNQRAELYAILVALYYIDKKLGLADKKIIIKSDSQYSINCVTKWVNGWKKNGWLKKDGAKVKNKEIISRIDHYLQNYDVEFEHVKAHTSGTDPDSVGNRMADKLAVSAHNKTANEINNIETIRIHKKSTKKEKDTYKSTIKREENFVPPPVPQAPVKKTRKSNRGKKDIDLLGFDPDDVEIKMV